MHATINPTPDGGWTVTLPPDTPVIDFNLGVDSDGKPALSLVMPVTSVQVGEPSPVPDRPVLSNHAEKSVSTWGTPVPDPREQIPGWKPEVAR